jgi:hypothetical protein
MVDEGGGCGVETVCTSTWPYHVDNEASGGGRRKHNAHISRGWIVLLLVMIILKYCTVSYRQLTEAERWEASENQRLTGNMNQRDKENEIRRRRSGGDEEEDVSMLLLLLVMIIPDSYCMSYCLLQCRQWGDSRE